MVEQGGLTFLDLQKTGCTHIQYLMEKYVETSVSYDKKHQPVGRRYKPSNIYAISVRDPFEQYSSLFRYGLEGRGGFYQKLAPEDKQSLYKDNSCETFSRWVEFIFDKKNAHKLGRGYLNLSQHSEYMGFFSYRLLCLAFRNISKALDGVDSKEVLHERVKRLAIPNYIIRNECLEDDFLEVLRAASKPNRVNRIILKKDINEIEKEIRDLEKTNVSKVSEIEFRSESEKEDIKKLIYSRESSYRFFGYNIE